MNALAAVKPPILNPALSPGRTLRKLFLTLFLRGRTSRGLRKATTPKSVGSKLALTLGLYALIGLVAVTLQRQPIFTLSFSLHGMTFVLLGMFVASSAGEVLFNKEEGEILSHRPITSRTLLWAKVAVLIEVSLWLAGAFNLVGFFVGTASPQGSWLFPVAHLVSTTLEALFCTACVVMTYQLCLRWFGRERLDGLMTTVQVFVAIVAVLGGQIVPQVIGRFGGKITFNLHSWWIALLPPAWFAGFDDALAGRGTSGSWALAIFGLVVTTFVLWLAFGKLASDYETGLQTLSEAVAPRERQSPSRRWLARIVSSPPFRWWLRDSVERASFLLTVAYLFRDRETKLRVYPGLAPMLVMPFGFLLQDRDAAGSSWSGFDVAFSGAYLGLIPLLALGMLPYSQQWQAADLFRAAPMPGPSPVWDGTRKAVLLFLTFPSWILFVAIVLLRRDASHLMLLLPGIIALPIYAMVPCLGGKAVPFSMPSEGSKSAGGGFLRMIGVMLISMALSALAMWSWNKGWFSWLILGEIIVVIICYAAMRASLARVRWSSLE